MNITAVSLENLFLPHELNYSSDSLVDPIDKVEEQVINDGFSILKKNIGEKLYNKLSPDQKMFIISVSGTINLGKSVDIKAIYSDIEKIEHE